MPDQDTMSISAMMDRVLADIKRTDRIFGLFHSPLCEVADGVGRLDKRIDKLEAKVDKGFADVDKRFEEVEAKVDKGFANIDKRFADVDKRFDRLDNKMSAWMERIGKYIERDERSDT